MNQNPEQIARDKIDQMLELAGWLVQSKDKVNLSAGIGVALRETNTESGSADYILFVNSKAVGVIEEMRKTKFKPRLIYYAVIRLLGGLWWNKKRRYVW